MSKNNYEWNSTRFNIIIGIIIAIMVLDFSFLFLAINSKLYRLIFFYIIGLQIILAVFFIVCTIVKICLFFKKRKLAKIEKAKINQGNEDKNTKLILDQVNKIIENESNTAVKVDELNLKKETFYKHKESTLFKRIDTMLKDYPPTINNTQLIIKTESPAKVVPKYKKASLMTASESALYGKLQNIIGNKYILQAQINLATIIKKTEKTRYVNELFRNLDYCVFCKNTLTPLVAIELNDPSHKLYERHQRDLKVRKILSDAGIPLITLYTSYDNEESYVKNRLSKHLDAL